MPLVRDVSPDPASGRLCTGQENVCNGSKPSLGSYCGMTVTLSRVFVSILVFAACSCTKSVVLPAAEGAEFDPIAFFKGHTHGEGDLHKLFDGPVHVSVDSIGRVTSEGLTLDQTIREANKPPNTRRWTIKRVAQHRYTGTLTDAVGAVSAEVVGPRAQIRYMMRHGLVVQQQLARQSDGTTVLNRLAVYKFGARVATLNETIKRVAP